MSFFKRKVEVPNPEEKIELEGVQLWRVDWISRYDNWSYSTRKETEVFTSEEDAKKFRDALKEAHKLIRNAGSETRVKMSKYNEPGNDDSTPT